MYYGRLRTAEMKKLATLALMLSTALASAGYASEIYKWTDEDGNIHYGDRPVADGTDGAQIERVAIASSPTNPKAVQTSVDSRRQRQAAAADKAAEREAEEARQQELQAEAADRAEKCTAYRARLEKFVQSRRLYRMDETGERVYLDESQMQEAREQVQQQVQEYCSS